MNREKAETYALAGIGLLEGVFNYYVKPELTAKRTWLAIGALVAFHEGLCPSGELLSEGADRAIEKHPLAIPLAIGVVAVHLANAVPEKYDLIHQGVRLIKKT